MLTDPTWMNPARLKGSQLYVAVRTACTLWPAGGSLVSGRPSRPGDPKQTFSGPAGPVMLEQEPPARPPLSASLFPFCSIDVQPPQLSTDAYRTASPASWVMLLWMLYADPKSSTPSTRIRNTGRISANS